MPIPARTAILHEFRELVVIGNNGWNHRRKEEQKVEQIPREPHFGGPHDVFGLLRKTVMAQVVPGDVGANRVSVGKTQDDLEPTVHLFVFEDRAMNGVVRDDGAKPGPNAGGDKEGQGYPRVGWHRYPLENKEKEVKAYKSQRALVSFVSQLKHASALS